MPSSHSLLLCAVVVLCLACLACGQMQVPSPRTTSDNQFNFASTPADDYCGDGNQKASGFQTAKSTLFIGSPANSIILNFNNPPGGGAGARFNFTLLSYRQNGTSFNRATNITTNIYYRTGLTQLLVTPANIVQNANNQKYLVTLPIDESSGLSQCGNTLTGSDAIYSQTRCVLRYVYDPAVAGQNSRVSCADVVIRSRSSESAVSVRVALASGDVPVGAATALRRLLSSAWATQTALLRIDLFQTPAQIAAGDGDQSAQQIRLADNAIAVSGDAYSMNFLFYDTVTFNANQLAGNFLAQGNDKLSLIFDLSVQQATMNGNASMPTPLAALMCMLASAVLLLVNKL